MRKPNTSSLYSLSRSTAVLLGVASCEGATVLICFKHYVSLLLYFVSRAQTTSCSPKIHHYLLPYQENSDFCWRQLYVQLQKLPFSANLKTQQEPMTQSGQWDVSKSCWAAESSLNGSGLKLACSVFPLGFLHLLEGNCNNRLGTYGKSHGNLRGHLDADICECWTNTSTSRPSTSLLHENKTKPLLC